jgi:uncharacterized protein
MAERRANRLAGETSPYLLQHAHNPVDWYPWGQEALERARREDRPIMLSIGYAACHWCHVMERESFEDPETAALLNERFVSIKVDREERPDLDSVYMDAVQAMTGQGGWPMTVFLTPDGEPFYGGTYYPPDDRHGLPSFRRVLDAVSEAWRDRRGEAVDQGRRLAQAIGRASERVASTDPLSEEVLRTAYGSLERSFDREWGGVSAGMKFPQPMTLEFLLRCHLRLIPGAGDLVRLTLDRMAGGGVYDQVGGGFHRYSVDPRWHVPHFEKMLYDNAQLARLYTRAWQVFGARTYRRIAQETLDYLLREMRNPGGGFYSSQDADSEGVEGKFFTWSFPDLVRLGGEDIAAYFGAAPAGNWEGTNVLWVPRSPAVVASEAGVGEDELLERVEAARRRLFEEREQRVRPATDDKVLASWNGLAIAAFAEAGRAFGEKRYLGAATDAASFIRDELRRDDGRLLRSWRDGRAGGPAFVDDQALMADAYLALSEATLDLSWLEESRRLADDLVRLFHDRDRGGFYQTGSDAEALVVRTKELTDNAMPSGNSAAADICQRLAFLYGEGDIERAGVSALRLVRDVMARAPAAFGHALCALDLYLSGAKEVALVGDPNGAEVRALAERVWSAFRPNLVLAAGSPGDPTTARIPLLNGRPMVEGSAAAYVCERFACRRPVTTADELERELTS